MFPFFVLKFIIYLIGFGLYVLVGIGRISPVYRRSFNVLIERMTVPQHHNFLVDAGFLISRTKRNVNLFVVWFCVFFIYQFVIDMNVSRCRGVPAVVSFRLCVDCNKFNQL